MGADLDAAASRIAAPAKAASGDEYSLLISLYQSVQKNVRYDKDELQAMSGTSNSPASHSAYGAIINRKAVCNGFYSAFALLAQKLGFECMVALRHSAYSLTVFSGHAWNVVKARGRFYHMDVTWDARKHDEFGEYSYEYFALRDGEISSDYSWDKTATPACQYNDLSYYMRNGLYANNAEQLSQAIKAHGSRQANVFRAKLSTNIPLPSNAGEYLAQRLANEGTRFTGNIRLIHGWNDNTRCFFAKIMN